MIEVKVQPGSDEWKQLRAGKPTASNFGKIVTTSGKRSTQWIEYRNKLIAERALGRPIDDFQNEHMKRGIELEPMAAHLYELHHDAVLKIVGFCFPDERKTMGFSPDRLIDIDNLSGGLEIKCPTPNVHIGYHLANKLPTTYKPQVWSSLYMSGLDFWDFMSYHPEITPFYIRVTNEDQDYLNYKSALEEYLPTFMDELEQAYQVAIWKGLMDTAHGGD